MIFQGLGFFFAWTWPLWAIAFVYFLVTAVSAAVREEADGKGYFAPEEGENQGEN